MRNNLTFAVLATIENFSRSGSYPGLYKSIKPVVKAQPVAVVNKCINTKVTRTKKTIDQSLKQARSEFKKAVGTGFKPVLLVSTKLTY